LLDIESLGIEKDPNAIGVVAVASSARQSSTMAGLGDRAKGDRPNKTKTKKPLR